jgi:hypothetical protein
MNPYNPFDITRLRAAADAAPSILNTKPWELNQVAADRIELRPDWTRHLEVIDPRHRELFISCGAALFNLRMAIRVTGHDPVIWLLPDAMKERGLLAPRSCPGRSCSGCLRHLRRWEAPGGSV